MVKRVSKHPVKHGSGTIDIEANVLINSIFKKIVIRTSNIMKMVFREFIPETVPDTVQRVSGINSRNTMYLRHYSFC